MIDEIYVIGIPDEKPQYRQKLKEAVKVWLSLKKACSTLESPHLVKLEGFVSRHLENKDFTSLGYRFLSEKEIYKLAYNWEKEKNERNTNS